MARTRRLAAAAGAITLASVFTAPPAPAQTAESYVGSAAGRALDLSVLSLPRVTLGVSTAKVTSALTAVAEGAGSLGVTGATQRAEITGTGSDVKPQSCAAAVPVGDILNVGIACGSASSSVVNNNPVATSEGEVAGVDLSGQNLLGAVAPLTGAVTGTVETTLGAVCGALSVTCDLTTTVGDVIDSVVETKTLEVSAGKSVSSVVTEAGRVTSTARSTGAEIRLLPTPEVGEAISTEPLATIIVGEAQARAVYDRATGSSTPTVDPALVRIRLNTVLTNSLGIGQEITVPVGQSIIVPGTEGTPLETEIVAAAGRTVTNPDGTVGAVADAVKVHALKGIGGGVLLSLAHAEAGVGGTRAQAAPIVPVVELPRTGGTPVLPMLGVGVLGLAVLVRRVLVRAH